MGEENLALKGHTHGKYIDTNKVSNDLTTTDVSMVLAATVGKYLNERLGAVRELYRAHLNPEFYTVECIPISGNQYEEYYFCNSFPDKFYIKSMDERSCITLDGRLNVLRRSGDMADIGRIFISMFEDYYVEFEYHESHGSYWWTQSENIVGGGYIIQAANSFKLFTSVNYYWGQFDSTGGVLQKFIHKPGQVGGEYENYYGTRIKVSYGINS